MPRSPALFPDAMQVFERGWLSSNNILFQGRDDTALIDSGYVTHAPQTLALLRHSLAGRPWSACSIRTCTPTIAAATRCCS